MAEETSGSSTNAQGQDLAVRVEGERVVVRLADGSACALTPEAAMLAAERLWDAAGEVRAAQGGEDGRKRPPFPPSKLVSPHGAG